MSKTPHLSMNFLIPNQSHKEIIYNESLIIMDALLSGSAIDIDINHQISNGEDGNLYILGDDPKGDWKGRNKHIVYFFDYWRFIRPKTGMSFFVVSKNALYRFIEDNWVRVS